MSAQYEEIKIPVSFSFLAAKWWGPQNERPIVALHGWQDNAGSFDTLIPLLPKYVGYLSIDLPGHGLSSHIPQGFLFSDLEYLHTFNRVFRNYFKWKNVSLIAHSMCSVICFLYASLFPDYVDMVIGFDLLKCHVSEPEKLTRILTAVGCSLLQAQLQNDSNSEPPVYSLTNIIDHMIKVSTGSLTREVAPYLLQRGIRSSKIHSDKYHFIRDNRIKFRMDLLVTMEVNKILAARIKCPYLFILEKTSRFNVKEVTYFMDDILKVMYANNKNFEMCTVDSGHHAHLTEPHKVSEKLCEFINKHRAGGLIHKL